MSDGLWQTLTGINRLEVIDDTGRAYVFWGEEGKVGIEMYKQDNERTIKIFINGERKRK